jgi:Skp family chaperone for outer membrane proteins
MSKSDKLGWIVAAGMAGALVMSGFQGTGMKFANCDVEKVFNVSNLTKENSDQLQRYGAKRVDILKFLGANRAMSPADTQTYADLELLAKPSDAETQKLNAIIAAAEKENAAQNDLIQKANPTADDQIKISSYRDKNRVNTEFTQKLEAKYDSDIREQQTKLKNDALDKVRKTIADLARKQGYSIVFNIDSAPFAANNLTDEVVKEVNKS